MAYPSKAKWLERPAASVALRYGLALVSLTIAQGLAHTFLHFHLPQPLTAFALCAIAITFRYGGTMPGIFAALLSALIRSYVFEPEISTGSRLCYDLVFLIFAMLMIHFTRERKELEGRVAERTAELTRANEGLKLEIAERNRAEEELRRLSGQLLHLQDEERRKIARDLHDSTGQNLVALATMLGQLRDSVLSGERKSRTLLSECKALADECIREIRTLSYELHPPALDEAGLEDAIRDYVTGFTNRSGIRVELELPPGLGRMARDLELALFRVVQEALTNIQRHSGSQHAKIRIDRNSHLTLEISDLGRGTSARERRGKEETRFEVGVGIPSMQERVKLIGGRLEIDSTSQGTTVRVTISLETNEREKAAHSGG
jgi:signal transduction histidine kinase